MPSRATDLEHQQRTEFLLSLSRVATAFAFLLVPGYALGLQFYEGAITRPDGTSINPQTGAVTP